jgi:hypothetical protein
MNILLTIILRFWLQCRIFKYFGNLFGSADWGGAKTKKQLSLPGLLHIAKKKPCHYFEVDRAKTLGFCEISIVNYFTML